MLVQHQMAIFEKFIYTSLQE